jgi:hypothetical protein
VRSQFCFFLNLIDVFVLLEKLEQWLDMVAPAFNPSYLEMEIRRQGQLRQRVSEAHLNKRT